MYMYMYKVCLFWTKANLLVSADYSPEASRCKKYFKCKVELGKCKKSIIKLIFHLK